uniref:uncharacterized protein LOC120330437 n=1 Tax=Styela clava TaxID=7725 RepID=UPI00193A24D3|nr:uncharacterized protein LOC120330437 [Styela clava]
MLTLKNILCISLLMLGISIEINLAKECKIPENNEDIDWDKVKNDWYLVLHTNDEVMNEDVIGAKLQNFSNTNEGMQMVVTNLHENSPPQTFTIDRTKRIDGVYYGMKSEKPAVLASHTLTQDGGTNNNAKKIDDALFNGDILVLYDKKNYLVHAFCSLSGILGHFSFSFNDNLFSAALIEHTIKGIRLTQDEWVVWSAFPTLNPTIHQISSMWNKLIEKGIIVQLYPSKIVEHPELMESLN